LKFQRYLLNDFNPVITHGTTVHVNAIPTLIVIEKIT